MINLSQASCYWGLNGVDPCVEVHLKLNDKKVQKPALFRNLFFLKCQHMIYRSVHEIEDKILTCAWYLLYSCPLISFQDL